MKKLFLERFNRVSQNEDRFGVIVIWGVFHLVSGWGTVYGGFVLLFLALATDYARVFFTGTLCLIAWKVLAGILGLETMLDSGRTISVFADMGLFQHAFWGLWLIAGVYACYQSAVCMLKPKDESEKSNSK